jgi:putative thioredoxin
MISGMSAPMPPGANVPHEALQSPVATPVVTNATTEDFPLTVIDRSRKVPVVVDFWAPWCGPCRVLGPVLEREVAALGGRVEMVKVNTDEHPGLASAFNIQGIPAVKAFIDGRIAAEFVGAQSAESIRSFLGKLVPSTARVTLAEARAAVAEKRVTEAEPLLRSLLADRDTGDEAALELARLLVASQRTDELETLWERLENSPLADRVTSLRTLASFAAEAAAFGGEEKARAALAADGKNWEARYALACALVGAGDVKGALEELLTLVSRQRKFRDDQARRAMLALFDDLGPESELVTHYRRQLQIVL